MNRRSSGTSTLSANCLAQVVVAGLQAVFEDVGHGHQLDRPLLDRHGVGGGTRAASAAADQGHIDRVVLSRHARGGQRRRPPPKPRRCGRCSSRTLDATCRRCCSQSLRNVSLANRCLSASATEAESAWCCPRPRQDNRYSAQITSRRGRMQSPFDRYGHGRSGFPSLLCRVQGGFSHGKTTIA